ncbi:MAG: hypothetical protein QM628_06995, partial [Propionicimonas sp.]
MKPDALSRVVLLLLCSRPFRGLLAVSLLAAMITLATSTSMAALRLSLEQSNTAYFGATQAVLQPDRPPMARPGQQIPDDPLAAAVGDRVQVVRVAWTPVSLRDASDGFTGIGFGELAMPSPALEGTVELIEGRWPRTPGECVAIGDVPERTGPPLGSWELTMVGRVTSVFTADHPSVTCAPGTWELWRMTPEQLDLTADAIGYQYYLRGDPQEVRQVVDSLVERGLVSADYGVSVRKDQRPPSAGRFLFDQAPMVALPLMLAAVLGGLVARWSGAVSRALERAGVPR